MLEVEVEVEGMPGRWDLSLVDDVCHHLFPLFLKMDIYNYICI